MAKMPYALVLCAGVLGTGCPEPEAGVPPEVVESQTKLDLPAPPAFEAPTTYADSTHSVTEMRRTGKKFLDQDIKIKGHIVWIYDCAQVLGEAVAKTNPEKCDRPNFYLGDTPDATPEKSVWVVEVPRLPREDEKRFLPKEDLATWLPVPKLTLGQRVIVEGKWAEKSPKGFVNSDGLLTYAGVAGDGGAVIEFTPIKK
jgi:hypothetical protein